MEVTEKIEQLLEEKYKSDEQFADCFTVEVSLKPANKLYVFMDSDSAMDFDKCRLMSRYLESFIDTNGWLGTVYTLEVSSPGIGRPLKFPRQFVKNIGRDLEVSLKDGSKLEGELTAADTEKIVLAYETTHKEGKKKVLTPVEMPILLEQINTAVVKISF